MKKQIQVLLILVVTIVWNSAYALDGTGTIEKIKVCGYGQPDSGWRNMMFFKLSDGNWFGVFGNYYHATSKTSDIWGQSKNSFN